MTFLQQQRKAARLVMISAVLVCAVAALAQTQPPQSATQPPAVKLNVLVLDDSKHAVGGLSQYDFRIMEDNVPQKVSFFSKEEVPLLYGLVIDNSGSIRRQLNDVVRAGRNIVAANRPGDETFLVRFVDSKKIKTLQSFTSDKEALGSALDELFIEGGQTALIDALAHSAQQLTEYRKGQDSYRRALILVTDGEERASRTKLETLIDFLRLADVQIFVIGLVEALDKDFGPVNGSSRDRAVRLLDRLAKETGGRAFYPRSLKEIPGMADEIMRDLHTQYVVGYTPASNPKSKSYRAVQVTVADAPGRGKLTAITRAGYTVARE